MRDFYTKKIMRESSCVTLTTLQSTYNYNISILNTLDLNEHLHYVSKLSQGDVVILDYFGNQYSFLINGVYGFSVICNLVNVDHRTLPLKLGMFKDGSCGSLPLNLLMTTKKLHRT